MSILVYGIIVIGSAILLPIVVIGIIEGKIVDRKVRKFKDEWY